MSDSSKKEKNVTHTMQKTVLIAGVLSNYSLSQVADLLKHAESLTGLAKKSAAIGSFFDQVPERLAVAANELDRLVGKGAKWAGDAAAASEISQAIRILNKLLDGPGISNAEGARAFDRLFRGAATFFKKLPIAGATYGGVVDAVGHYHFFENVRRNAVGMEQREIERQTSEG